MNESNLSDEIQIILKDEAFPFTLGEGFEKILLKIGYKSNYDFQNKTIKILYNVLFEVNKQYTYEISGSIQIRADNIRKKIKSGFHKCIIKIINDDIKINISDKKRKYYFVNLPQIFIANVNKEENSEIMNMTFENLLLYWINEKNKNMIEYLNDNPDLCEKTIWNKIKNKTYKELLEAYFISAEFEKSICNLQEKSTKKSKNVSALYIESYINLALSYIDFYTTPKKVNYIHPKIGASSLILNPDESIYFYEHKEENPIHIDQEEPIATFIEHPLRFSENQLIDNETIILDEEYDSSNEKMSCSDNDEKMNDSFDEKNGKKFYNDLLKKREKKFM